ncbi:MAG: AI-2E family transporter [bacterium]
MNSNTETKKYATRALITVAIAALVLVFLYLFHLVAHILLMVFACILLAVTLEGATSFVNRHSKLNKHVALTILVMLMLGSLGVMMWFGGSLVVDQGAQLSKRIPEAIQTIRRALAQNELGKIFLPAVKNPEALSSTDAAGLLAGFLSTVIESGTAIIIVVIVGIYLSSNPALYVDNALLLFPKGRRKRVREIADAIGLVLQRWIIGRLLIMVIVGAISVVSFLLIGLPSAILLGVFAGLMAFIPYLGAFAAAVPAILVGFTVGKDMAFYTFIVYVVMHVIEGYIITPVVEGRSVSLPAALIVLAQVLCGALFGVIGVLFATPLMVVFIIIIQMVYIEDVLGDSVTILGEK